MHDNILIVDKVGEDKLESLSRYSLAIKRFGEIDEFLLRHSRRISRKVLFSPDLTLDYFDYNEGRYLIRTIDLEIAAWPSASLRKISRFHLFSGACLTLGYAASPTLPYSRITRDVNSNVGGNFARVSWHLHISWLQLCSR